MDAVRAFVHKSAEFAGREEKEELNVDTAVEEYEKATESVTDAAATGALTQNQAEQLDILNTAVDFALRSMGSSSSS